MMIDGWTADNLISREALKKAFEDTVCIEPMPYAFVKQIIDNAPAVEYTFEEAFQKTVCENKLYCPARPQGKWIECTKSGMPLTEYGRMMGEKWYGFKCSRCKYIYKGNALVESPYCQECGAKMDKEVDNG